MSLRTQLVEAIKAHEDLPKGWKVQGFLSIPDNPTKPVLIVRQESLTRTPQAPKDFYDFSFLVTLIVPEQDQEKAEESLDTAVETVLDILESLSNVRWSEATRVLFESFNAFDFTITVTQRREPVS